MKRIAMFLTLLMLLSLSITAQTLHFVKHDATGNNDGTSWADAFTSLQAAISAATSGDSIYVAKGTYVPSEEVGGSGARFRTFQMKNGVAIYGGFEGNEYASTFDLDDRDFDAHETILSGDLGNGDNVYHVFRHVNLGLDNTAILDGFTISGGKADGSDPDNKSGGMLNSGSTAANGSSPTIRNCVFKNNEAEEGGAMYNSRYSSPVTSNTVFENNTATDIGGAVYIFRNNSTFSGCTFLNNTASGTGSAKGGGAVYISTSAVTEGVTFTNCSFLGNTVNKTSSGGRGGAIHASINPGFSTITGSTFQQNEAQYGGALYHSSGNNTNRDASDIKISNSTFEQNKAEYGGGIFSDRHNTIVTSCIIRGNEATEQSGGYYGRNGSSEIINSLLSGNKSEKHGGGAYFNNETPEIINTTISGNYAGQRGGGISMIGGSTLEIKNTIVWGNASPEGNELWLCNDCTTNIDYSLYGNALGDVFITNGGTVNVTSSQTVNPNFLNPLAPTSGNTPNIWGNYFICGCSSPCVDAGNNAYVPTGLTTDLRGVARIQDGNVDGTPTVDLGAYEFDPTGCNALAPFAGNGSIGNPYEISMIQHLYWVAVDPTRWGYHYIQTANIDAALTQNWFDGEGWTPIGNSNIRFSGTYDGQGYSISNLFINRPDVREVGLFGEIGGTLSDKAILKNITLLNADVTAERQVGALVGRAQQNNDIINCHVSGSVKGTRNVGGLVGHGIRTDFLRCSSSATVSLIGTNAMYHGGLMGHINNASTVKESFATGNVHGRTRVGGLIGAIGWNSSVEDSYARGAVSSEGLSNPLIGGLVGEVWNAGIRRSYSTGLVETTSLSGGYGGLVGDTTTDSNFFDDDNFWDTETSGLSTSEMGTGKTTAEMKTESTFTDAGWDFIHETDNGTENIWGILASYNDGYPFLVWGEKDIWTGDTDSDWSEKANWYSGQLPDANSKVTIPTGAVVVIEDQTNAEVLDIIIQSGATLTVENGGQLDVAGNMYIYADETGNGSLIDKGTLDIAGTVIVQKYIEDNIYGTSVSVPVQSAAHTIFDDADGFFAYSHIVADWEEFTGTMETMRGYWTRYSSSPGVYVAETVEFNAALNTGELSFSELYRTGYGSGNFGWNFIGNPYPSAIDWNIVVALPTNTTINNSFVETTNLKNQIHVSDSAGGYHAFVDGVDNNDIFDGLIPMGTAFWIQVYAGVNNDENIHASDPTAGPLYFDNSTRVHNNNAGGSKKSNTPNLIRLQLCNGQHTNNTVVRLRQGATLLFDPAYDASKMFSGNPAYPQTYSVLENGEKVAINAIPDDITQASIPIAYKNEQGNELTFTARNLSSLDSDISVHLEDKFTTIMQDLRADNVYNFSINSSQDEERFVLHLARTNTSLTEICANTKIDIYTYQSTLYVNQTSENTLLAVYNMLGQEVYTSQLQSSGLHKINLDVNTGHYIVSVTGTSIVKTEKVFVK